MLPKIQDGVLLVFASRNLLDQFLLYWDGKEYNSYYLNQLTKLKKVFIEPFSDQEAKKMREEYVEECEKGKGAIFMLTARGRLIEGIDFKDE
jgi:Rad3-related DNA helicase